MCRRWRGRQRVAERPPPPPHACSALTAGCPPLAVLRLVPQVKAALEWQLMELTGSAEERAGLQEAREKEARRFRQLSPSNLHPLCRLLLPLLTLARPRNQARVELLHRQGVRRSIHRDLYGGWSAWVDHWQAGRHAHRRLEQAVHRLRAPSLSAAFLGAWPFLMIASSSFLAPSSTALGLSSSGQGSIPHSEESSEVCKSSSRPAHGA